MESAYLSQLVLAYFGVATLTGVWVFVDGRARSVGGGHADVPARWAAATFLLLPVFLPIYLLLVRPAGDLVACPTCQRATLSNRAACAHCGSPLAFETPAAMWGMGDVIGVALVFLFLPVAVVAMMGFERIKLTLDALTTLVILQDGVPLTLMLYVVRKRYAQPLSALGVRWERAFPLLGLGLLVGLAAIPISTVTERLATFLIGTVIGHARAEALAAAEQAGNLLAEVLRHPLTTRELVWLLVLIGVLVPIGEELFFRGFVYGAVRAHRGVPLAVGLSALLFALAHQYVFDFLPILVLGVILAVLYERTRTLLPGVVVHGVNNIVAVLVLLYKNGWHQ